MKRSGSTSSSRTKATASRRAKRVRTEASTAKLARALNKWLPRPNPCTLLKGVRRQTRELEYAVAAGDMAQMRLIARDIAWLARRFRLVRLDQPARALDVVFASPPCQTFSGRAKA